MMSEKENEDLKIKQIQIIILGVVSPILIITSILIGFGII